MPWPPSTEILIQELLVISSNLFVVSSSQNMSGCSNGGCSCGSSCSCGSDCKCGKMFPDISEKQTTTASETFVIGFSPAAKGFYDEESEMGVAAAAENDGCKCGSSCSCDPCTCK